MNRLLTPILSALAAGAVVAGVAVAGGPLQDSPRQDPSTCFVEERPETTPVGAPEPRFSPVARTARCNVQTASGRVVVFMRFFEDGSARVSVMGPDGKRETLRSLDSIRLGHAVRWPAR